MDWEQFSESEGLLAALLGRPAWHRDALCAEYPEVDFFPSAGQSSAAAQAVCRRCLVRDACLADALDRGEDHGIWGGTNGRGRRLLRQEQGLVRRCAFDGCGRVIADSKGSRCADHLRSCSTPGCSGERAGRAAWCLACRRERRRIAA